MTMYIGTTEQLEECRQQLNAILHKIYGANKELEVADKIEELHARVSARANAREKLDKEWAEYNRVSALWYGPILKKVETI